MKAITREYVITTIDELIKLGTNALQTEHKTSGDRIIALDYLSGPNYKEFKSKLKVFADRCLMGHPLYDEILNEMKSFYPIGSTENIVQHLVTIKADQFFLEQFESENNAYTEEKRNCIKAADESFGENDMKPKIFVVYGHDIEALKEVELFLHRIECSPIILQNEPSGGLTIIEKIEQYTKDPEFAIVLYTACDEGRLKEEVAIKEGKNKTELKSRARQNVVFEHGFLISKLSRKRVVALVEKDVETPGDVDGVVYVSMSDDDWRQQIMKELQNAGVNIKNMLDAGIGSIKKEQDFDFDFGDEDAKQGLN